MTVKQVRVYSPGSIANLGPGFDVIGVALNCLGDIVRLEKIDEPEVRLSVKGVGADKIPVDPKINSSGAVLQLVRERYDVSHGFKAEIRKGVPPGKGMGSSGASASATAIAVDHLLGLGLNTSELIGLAAYGEGAVAGAPHADNVAASILGGYVLVGEDYDVVRLDAPNVGMVVVAPEINIENKTRTARELLPEKVSLMDAVKNIGYATRMTAGVALGDPVLFGRSIYDNLVEPHRAAMIPNFWEVKQAALDAGAYGCSISGGGPSVFAVGEPVGEIAKAMVEAFSSIETRVYHTTPSNRGARVI
ncbi:MAG TPA: homoserine kinase [Candidatus Krumholzibacteriaceae bacterium]|nr:homoserine kinase [Candidatus Krumholzibacteriaceae bacterium]